MKWWIAVLVLVVVLAGCTIPLSVEEVPAFEDVTEASRWVKNNIEYAYDTEVWNRVDYWQFPEETLELRTGDCEDKAILLMAIIIHQGLGDPLLILGANSRYEAHAWVEVGDGAWDPTNYPERVDAKQERAEWERVWQYTWGQVENWIWEKRSEMDEL
jgi:transglutaminase-like putative cysteine protease